MKVKDINDHKTAQTNSLSRNLSEFEKNFLWLSGAILAFSITFIQKIVEVEVSTCLFLLYFSWGLIIVSMGIMMLTFIKSSMASDEIWKILDDFLIEKNLARSEDDIPEDDSKKIKAKVNETFYKRKAELKRMRFGAIGFFIAGLLLLLIYVSVNLSTKNAKAASKAVNAPALSDSIIVISGNKVYYYSRSKNQNTVTHEPERKTPDTTKTR